MIERERVTESLQRTSWSLAPCLLALAVTALAHAAEYDGTGETPVGQSDVASDYRTKRIHSDGDATWRPDLTLGSRNEKESYALGVEVGKGLLNQSIMLSLDAFVQGVTDGLSGDETLMTDEEVRAVVKDLRRKLKRRRATFRTEEGLKNKQAGERFLAENAAREGVVTLESGLQYEVLEAGSGIKPTLDDSVVANFRGILLDGTEFANSYGRKRPPAFAMKRVVKGWQKALQLMPVGSKWRLFVPPHLAYGKRGASPLIGPDATLIFEVSLIAVEDSSGSRERSSQRASTNTTLAGASNETDLDARLAAAVADIKLAFKLDRRLTQGMYMGERWVSPPVYNSTLQPGNVVTVEARALGVNAKGKHIAPISPEWKSADPDKLTVSPARGHEVKIKVQGPGETSLRVAFGDVSKTLTIRAEYRDNRLAAQIIQ